MGIYMITHSKLRLLSDLYLSTCQVLMTCIHPIYMC